MIALKTAATITGIISITIANSETTSNKINATILYPTKSSAIKHTIAIPAIDRIEIIYCVICLYLIKCVEIYFLKAKIIL
jgi:hypothetical protein